METDKIYLGNNIDILKTFKDNSIDSVVTDPPYGISFMGKKWDYDVPSVELWQEVLRVLKPGGHALVACGTRTQHRMAVNLEDAGFEIRDIVAWVYGSGFPKSHDVAKAIEGQLVHGSSNTQAFNKLDGVEIDGKLGFTKTQHVQGARPNDYTDRHKSKTNIKYTTNQAKQWQGWGTALKPAMELWTLCRKPIKTTVAENVLQWGVGGINVDGCRVNYGNESDNRVGTDFVSNGGDASNNSNDNQVPNKHYVQMYKSNGRFPANFIHDGSDEVVSLFPETTSGKMNSNHTRHTNGSPNGIYGAFDIEHPLKETIGDSGSAARFFYTAKASQSERNDGLNNFDWGTIDDGRTKTIDNPFQRGETKKKNIHPTVKPVELMTYLCRMITPKNGIVLDPFAGSGSTLIAAKQEKFQYVGIEIDEQYHKIAEARVKAAIVQYSLFD